MKFVFQSVRNVLKALLSKCVHVTHAFNEGVYSHKPKQRSKNLFFFLVRDKISINKDSTRYS